MWIVVCDTQGTTTVMAYTNFATAQKHYDHAVSESRRTERQGQFYIAEVKAEAAS